MDLKGIEQQLLSYRATNLLRHFSGGVSEDNKTEASGDSDEIELGLSLGGCFRSQDRGNNRLVRSSSIPALLPSEIPLPLALARTCSLPNETEEEVRRRKELQSLKRMVAKRKREKKRNSKRAIERSEEKIEGGFLEKVRKANGILSPGLPRWIPGSARPTMSLKTFPPASQGSVASQGSSSSAGSELESRPGQGVEILGFSCGKEVRSLSRVFTVAELNNLNVLSVPSSVTEMMANSSNGNAHHKCIVGNMTRLSKEGVERPNRGVVELRKNMIEGMPSVSTRGSGPNGRRIDGFLCKYRRGEEVRIVCVCHGSYLSPSEFVKHAGGRDVAHPLRHILVNPSHATLLLRHRTDLSI